MSERINPDSVDIDVIESRHFGTMGGTSNPYHDMLDLIGAARGYQERVQNARDRLDTFFRYGPDPAEAYDVLIAIERVLRG